MKVIGPLFLVLFLVVVALVGAGSLGMQSLFGYIIPYAALAIFVVGVVYRIFRWASSPVPFHIPTVCGQQKSLSWIKGNTFESPSSTAGVIGRMALEILLFRSLFRNDKVQLDKEKQVVKYRGNRWLWLGGLAFHWSLFIILFRHTRLLFEPIPAVVGLVRDIDGMLQNLIPMITITDMIIVVALSYLVLRRIFSPQIRFISLPSDYLAPFLILAVVLSGVLMKLVYQVDFAGVKSLAMSVITFHPVVPAGITTAFFVHLFLVSSLLMYFPFSKMMHSAGIFLSPTRNLANDSRRRRHVNHWNYPVKVHTYAEWEDEFRDAMKKVGLPLEKDVVAGGSAPVKGKH